jgi:hypothetical protein
MNIFQAKNALIINISSTFLFSQINHPTFLIFHSNNSKLWIQKQLKALKV